MEIYYQFEKLYMSTTLNLYIDLSILYIYIKTRAFKIREITAFKYN